MLDKLAEEREIKVEQSELTQWLINQAARYGMSPDQFANALVEGGQVQMAIAEVRRAKALSLVVDAATVTDSDGNRIDFDQLVQELTEATIGARRRLERARRRARSWTPRTARRRGLTRARRRRTRRPSRPTSAPEASQPSAS